MTEAHSQVQTAPHRRDRLVLLDGMRGIAAIAVMMHHLEHAFGHGGPFIRSYLFVDFFFLLSGFVLTLAAEERMNSGWGTMGFMRARIRRLWPTVAIGACLGAVQAGLAGQTQDLALLLLLALLFIPNPLQRGDAYPLNNPAVVVVFRGCRQPRARARLAPAEQPGPVAVRRHFGQSCLPD